MKIVLLALLLCAWSPTQSPSVEAYSVWTCKGYEPWPTVSENINSTITFQNWLYAWHHSCEGTGRSIISSNVLNHNGGYGHSFQQIAQKMVGSIESNQIFVSREDFLWADDDANNCTLQVKTVDCYFEPTSTCGYGDRSKTDPYIRTDINLNASLHAFINAPIDSCTMAKKAKKSLIWVYGQFLKYLIRPRRDVLEEVRTVTDPILSLRGKHENSSILAVHIRGGLPDGGRVPLNISDYIPHIDDMAAFFARQGKPVAAVYFCSDIIEDNARSSQYMSTMFPRAWKPVVIPRIGLGSGEAELNLKNPNIANKPSKRRLMVDFLIDLEILTNADGFIGSGSNIYFMASAMRAANQAGPRNATCLLSKMKHDGELSYRCENSEHMKSLWTRVSGGYDGGSSFAEY